MGTTVLDDDIDPSAKYLTRPVQASVEISPAIVNEPASTGKSKVNLEGLNEDLKERIDLLRTLWKEDRQLNPKGTDLPITSGARTREEQKDLYRRMLRGDPGIKMALNPDQFPNAKGFHNDAIDLLTHVPNSLLEKVGLHRPYGDKDPVHVQINPSVKWQKPNLEKTSVLIEDDVDPYAKYVQQQGTYVEPPKSTTQTMETEFDKLKNIGYLPKQAAALYDTLYGTVPSAINFVGTPFAKLADLGGQGINKLAGKPIVSENVATGPLNILTDTMQRPLGKAFGITEDPAYTGEASQRIMQYVGENMDKGATYLAEKTGLNKADIEWYMNAAMLAAGPKVAKVAGNVASKGVELAKELPGKTKETLQNKFPSLVGEENPNLRSVGAAELSMGKLRQARAHELLVPMDLPRDIVTREFKDINWSREKAKDAVTGELLRQNYSKLNKQLIDNLDSEIIETGAQKTGIDRSQLGEDLVLVIQPYKTARYGKVKEAYKAADTAGETLQQVSYQPVLDYINNIKEKRPTQYEQNPILKMVEEDIKANDPNNVGSINLRQYDDIAQLINAETEYGTSNGFHGNKIRSEIDELTKGKGGALYQNARSLNNRYMKEFEENPAIRDITAIKKGTTERKVAIENLVEDSMLKGPRSRVEELFKTLENAGPEGQQMINELRGVVAEQIKNQSVKGVGRDINGNPIVSAPGLNDIIQKLDKSGKLELIFGKKGAERYRTLNDVVIDVKTLPEGSVNYSGSAAGLKNLAAQMTTDLATSALIGVPAPITTVGTLLYKHQKNKKELNKISEFINYGKEQK